MRMDKWLWAARFFKTRSVAAHACELGRVAANGVDAKPSREVKVGDKLQVRNEAGIFQVEVLALSETRGPAAVARLLYAESDESKAARAAAVEARKLVPVFDRMNDGKISKRDRREFERLRGRD